MAGVLVRRAAKSQSICWSFLTSDLRLHQVNASCSARGKINDRKSHEAICRDMHTSPCSEAMMRPTRRKSKAKALERKALRNKFERLDEEDRPTGCLLCPMRTDVKVDYKNVRLLSQFISPHTGRIYGSYVNGLCKAKQDEVQAAIKYARSAGYMSNTMKHLEFHNDPKLF